MKTKINIALLLLVLLSVTACQEEEITPTTVPGQESTQDSSIVSFEKIQMVNNRNDRLDVQK